MLGSGGTKQFFRRRSPEKLFWDLWSVEDIFADHIGRHGQPHLRQDGRGEIVQGDFLPAGFTHAWSRTHINAVEIVVGVVGACVVFEGEMGRIADRADASPVEITEQDDQVGRGAVDLAINLVRAIHFCAHGLAFVIDHARQSLGQFIGEFIVVFLRDLSVGFPALDVEEASSIVAAFDTGTGFGQVDLHIGESCGLGGMGREVR